MQIREPLGGQLEILSTDDVDRIHGATMEVLSRLGVRVWSPQVLKLFRGAGAEIDEETRMTRLPESLVKETVRRAPSEFVMHGRDPRYVLHYGGRRVHFSLAGQPVNVQDLEGNVRPGTLRDVENLARIADSCENIHHLSRMTTPHEVPAEVHHLHTLWALWRNSVKPTNGYNYGERRARETIDMAAIVRGGHDALMREPFLMGITNPVSPMQLSKDLIEGAMVYARYRQPMVYAPEAISGVSAPATLAGLLVQQNAEVLAGIVVSQLVNPGTPVLYGTASTVLDMRTGGAALGGPEVGLLNLATAQLARYYHLPSRGTGGNTDSKVADIQAGLESMMGVLLAALAGMNFIYDAAGSLEGSLTLSYEKLVVDDEVCAMISRILSGIEVTDETLAVDEIGKAGPAASHLGTPFTHRMFRREHFLPTLLDRRAREAWARQGGKDLAGVARERARKILAEHAVEPLDAEVVRRVDEFLLEATKGNVA
jgi:trimethylamine--corrinoid protein Co-methyltransferase